MAALLNKFKAQMTITWNDSTIDTKLNDILASSMKAIDELVDDELNYETDLVAQELMFNRARYAYNNALEFFESNFASEILRLQLRVGVDKHAAETTNS